MPQSPGFDADPAVERLAEEGNEVGEEARVGARFCARHQTLRNPPYWPEFPTLALLVSSHSRLSTRPPQ